MMQKFYGNSADDISDLLAVEFFVRYCCGEYISHLSHERSLNPDQIKNVLLRGAQQSFWYLTSEPIEQRFIVAGDVIRPWMDEKKRREDQRTISVARVRISSGRINATQPDDPPRGVWVE